MPFRGRRFVPYMTHAFINPYVIATISSIDGSLALLDDFIESYATCLWNRTVCILGGLLLLRHTQIISIFSLDLFFVCLADDEDLFRTGRS